MRNLHVYGLIERESERRSQDVSMESSERVLCLLLDVDLEMFQMDLEYLVDRMELPVFYCILSGSSRERVDCNRIGISRRLNIAEIIDSQLASHDGAIGEDGSCYPDFPYLVGHKETNQS